MIRKVLLSTVFAATAGAAVAADLPSTKGPAPFVAPPVFTWTGFYVGLNAGGQFGSTNARLVVPAIVNGVANNINANANVNVRTCRCPTNCWAFIALARGLDCDRFFRSRLSQKTDASAKPTFEPRGPDTRRSPHLAGYCQGNPAS